ESDEFEQVLRTSRLAVAFREHAHGFGHREHPEVAGLLQHDADPGAPAAARCPRIFTENAHLPCIAFAVTFKNLDRRRLAGSVGTEDRKDLAIADVEIQIPHRMRTPIGLRQTTNSDSGRHDNASPACCSACASSSASISCSSASDSDSISRSTSSAAAGCGGDDVSAVAGTSPWIAWSSARTRSASEL